MQDKIKKIQQEIDSITNCINCLRDDGCYNCKNKKPNYKAIKKMLMDLKQMETDIYLS